MTDMILAGEDYNRDYPREILSKALQEFREYCENILPEIHSAGRLMVEARLYGQLIQMLDKYHLQTRGLSLAMKIGYYETEIAIQDCRGRELGTLFLGCGQLNPYPAS